MSKSWIEISKKSLLFNVTAFRSVVGNKVLFCGVIKANAYGHGLKEVSSVLEKSKIDWFAVDSANEALSLKGFGIKKPILVLGYVRLSELEEVINKNISFVVYNLETLKKIVTLSLKKKALIHLKIETGLNRQGIKEIDISKFVEFIKSHKDKFITEGISMHFANIEDTKDPSFAKLQLKRFNEKVKEIETKGIKFDIKHATASAGVILYPSTHLDMVRVGIGLYGLHPSKETIDKIILKPVMTWKTVIAQVKNVSKSESVSYGRTWVAKKKTKIAVIPAGYSDGFDRKLSNCGRVIVKGKYAPVIGRICMNMFMVDVTEISSVQLEDEVIIIGKNGNLEITADEIAQKIGTINYEVVSRINPLLPRIVVN